MTEMTTTGTVTAPVADMVRAFTVAKVAVAQRPGLPVLACVLLGDGMVRSFDYETSATVMVPALDTFPAVAVPFTITLDILKKLPKRGTVTIGVDGDSLTLTVDGGVFRVPLGAVKVDDGAWMIANLADVPNTTTWRQWWLS